MTKHLNTTTRQEDEVPQLPYSQLEKWLIGFACISYFPLFYLIGKALTSWLN